MIELEKSKELRRFALQIRKETIRTIGNLGVGHVGGALSICDVLAVLYGGVMNVDPKQPKKPDRDWLVVSKGHAGPAVYATLALRGFFPGKAQDGQVTTPCEPGPLMRWPLIVLAVLCLLLGMFPTPLIEFARAIAAAVL